ncbi:UNVERIFIED_CONTAM: hypothetical protein K2H54_003779 [Gekko kuhli]
MMGDLPAGETRGAGGAGRRRTAVRALSRLARRLLQTLRGARRGRGRAGGEAEEDEGGFGRLAGPARGQAGGGAPGLQNHGNTCFLNAVLQCLSHTQLLAAFLLGGAWPPPPAAPGEVTRHLAALVRALWTRRYTPQLSADFKNAKASLAGVRVLALNTPAGGEQSPEALACLAGLLQSAVPNLVLGRNQMLLIQGPSRDRNASIVENRLPSSCYISPCIGIGIQHPWNRWTPVQPVATALRLAPAWYEEGEIMWRETEEL